MQIPRLRDILLAVLMFWLILSGLGNMLLLWKEGPREGIGLAIGAANIIYLVFTGTLPRTIERGTLRARVLVGAVFVVSIVLLATSLPGVVEFKGT